MIQGRGAPGFGFESAQLRFVRRQVLWEKLECGFAPKLLVPREKNFAHSAYADE